LNKVRELSHYLPCLVFNYSNGRYGHWDGLHNHSFHYTNVTIQGTTRSTEQQILPRDLI